MSHFNTFQWFFGLVEESTKIRGWTLIKSILENISKFTETQFVLSSFEDFAAIRKFYFDNGLNSFTTVFIGQETDYSLTKQIKYSSFPCLIFFDKYKKYLKKIDEESNAKEILKTLKLKYK